MAGGGGPALNKPALEKTLLRLDWDKTRLRTPSQVVRAPRHDTGRKGDVRKSGDLGPLWERRDLIRDLGKGASVRCEDQKVIFNLIKRKRGFVLLLLVICPWEIQLTVLSSLAMISALYLCMRFSALHPSGLHGLLSMLLRGLAVPASRSLHPASQSVGI